jgi:hypothetical protein
MKRIRKFFAIIIFSLKGICVVLLAISALGNLTLSNRSTSVEALSADYKARLAATWHLLRELGEKTWPGWVQTDTPLIVYNEEYASWLVISTRWKAGTRFRRVFSAEGLDGTFYNTF